MQNKPATAAGGEAAPKHLSLTNCYVIASTSCVFCGERVRKLSLERRVRLGGVVSVGYCSPVSV